MKSDSYIEMEEAFHKQNTAQIASISAIHSDKLFEKPALEAIEAAKTNMVVISKHIEAIFIEKKNNIDSALHDLRQEREALYELKANFQKYSKFKSSQYTEMFKESNVWRTKIIVMQELSNKYMNVIQDSDLEIKAIEENIKKLRSECNDSVKKINCKLIDTVCKSVQRGKDYTESVIAKSLTLLIRHSSSIESIKDLFLNGSEVIAEIKKFDPSIVSVEDANKNITIMKDVLNSYKSEANKDKIFTNYNMAQWVLSSSNLVIEMDRLITCKQNKKEVLD